VISTKEMPRETHGEFPPRLGPYSWPSIFKQARTFSRDEENKSYLEFVQGLTILLDAASNDGDDDEETSAEDRDEVEQHSTATDHARTDDKGDEAHSRYDNVRVFMTALGGHESVVEHPDQVEVVLSFFESVCESESNTELQTAAKDESTKPVALLDERSNGHPILRRSSSWKSYLDFLSTRLRGQNLSTSVPQRHRRPDLGPLTSKRLREELRKKVA
jgi:hypothetical protein